MPNLYSPQKKSVGELLAITSPELVVPEWQRNYSWTTSEVEVFWQDVLRFEHRFPGNNLRDREYFIGSIVLVDSGEQMLVLDGQQRLATAAMFLSAIRDVVAAYNANSAQRLSQQYLTNYDDIRDQTTWKISLNRYDRDFFRREVLESRLGDYVQPDIQYASHKRIRVAREYFVKALASETENLGPQAAAQRSLRLANVLTNHVSMISVVSSDEDNAAEVFETLNDRGLGLSTPDLLRNLILRRAPEERIEEILNCWEVIQRIDDERRLQDFFRHFWLSREGDVKAKSLYREIKGVVQERDIESLEIARDLANDSEIYSDFLSARWDNDGIAEDLKSVKDLNAKALYPCMLSAAAVYDEDEFAKVLRALLVTYVRHSVIVGRDNSSLENTVFGLASSIRQGVPALDVEEELRNFAPDDETFSSAFSRVSIGRMASARYLLTQIEMHLRETEELDVANPPRVHVEHIYPQNPDVENVFDRHNLWVNRLGNLTLLSRRLNTQAKNGNFDVKRPFYEQSDLLVTRRVLEYNEWTPEFIERRQAALAELCSDIWSI